MAFTTSGQETEWALFLQPRSPHGASHRTCLVPRKHITLLMIVFFLSLDLVCGIVCLQTYTTRDTIQCTQFGSSKQYYVGFVYNFLLFPTMKIYLENRLFWQSYHHQLRGPLFFWGGHSVCMFYEYTEHWFDIVEQHAGHYRRNQELLYSVEYQSKPCHQCLSASSYPPSPPSRVPGVDAVWTTNNSRITITPGQQVPGHVTAKMTSQLRQLVVTCHRLLVSRVKMAANILRTAADM